jgi:membrane associated rhomboid family serine protease
MKKNLDISISYNAPVTLTYALICACILLLNSLVVKAKPDSGGFIPLVFSAPGTPFDWKSLFSYLRLFTHIFGHTDWNHYIGNFSFIILLGPLMEERYGSKILTLMFLVTGFVTGVINSCIIPYPLMGGSGIVFMLIVLSSISSLEKKKIPLSFVCVILIYFGREIYNGVVLHSSNISVVAHIVGGLCGSFFGFMIAPKSGRKKIEGQGNLSQEPIIVPPHEEISLPPKPEPKPESETDSTQAQDKGDDDKTEPGAQV